MSLYDYQHSRQLYAAGHSFYSLVMAAMRQADAANLDLLRAAFPAVWDELQQRYQVPGGVLPEDHEGQS